MGKFRVEITDKAKVDIEKHYRSGNKASIKKLEKILIELSIHPEAGTGRPERLKHNLSDYWSRCINHKDRMIYSIDNDKVVVEVISAMDHYFDN